MVNANKILNIALKELGFMYSKELFIPNIYLGRYEMDIMRLNSLGYIIEYEIKISKADFRKDAKKGYTGFGRPTVTKYDLYRDNKSKSNRFFYIVPKGLVLIDEVPEFAGLIYIDIEAKKLEIIKNAPLMHRNKHFKTMNDFMKLAIKCSHREMNWKNKYEDLKNKKHK